jgi:hypothetical protein
MLNPLNFDGGGHNYCVQYYSQSPSVSSDDVLIVLSRTDLIVISNE